MTWRDASPLDCFTPTNCPVGWWVPVGDKGVPAIRRHSPTCNWFEGCVDPIVAYPVTGSDATYSVTLTAESVPGTYIYHMGNWPPGSNAMDAA